MNDLAWTLFFLVSSLSAVALLSCTITAYLDLWQLHEQERRDEEPARLRVLRSTWFFYASACACLVSVAGLLYVT
ncbi:hypothetical protein P9239_21575 [Caballeronia sp. LZ062]|uniref:hypothetical protein n=1 Tax=unclassified Caballeronia TaxID=2646786 RepID=UPI002855336C|nr:MULTISPECIES: hypothetical protein [unclassified Caballeronia]MDR5856270.1 hypothetical protein [Caballeronia sp. LZ050]MDR5872941.1 hypothetical protein [Caballeronia sp. LZ062]